MSSPRFCIGTVKLGDKNYGYSSAKSDRNVDDFFNKCKELGIYNFDTSPRYGLSEQILGKYLKSLSKNKVFVSTKVDGLIANSVYAEEKIRSSIEKSLSNLNLNKIDLLYLHQNSLKIISDKFILDALIKVKQQGLIGSIGASIYNMDELQYVMKNDIFDYVQIPINISDIYFYNILLNSKSKIKIVARSIFLQGLLLNLEKGENIKYYQELSKAVDRLNNILKDHNLDLRKALIAYIFSLKNLSMVIMGTTSLNNLEINHTNSKINLNNEIMEELNKFSKDQALWTNPRNW